MAARVYGSVDADDAVRATVLVLSNKRRRRQLAAGALVVLGLCAVHQAGTIARPTRALALTAIEGAASCPVVFGYDVVAYHLGAVAQSQAGLPGSAAFAASLTTSYGTYTFWFVNTINRDAFVENPWKYAPRMGGHCTASVAYVDGASKVVTGASSVPICVGAKDPYVEATMGSPWVLVDDKLYFFNCDANWIFSAPKEWTSTGSKQQLEAITGQAEQAWLAEFDVEDDGPFNTADYCSWLFADTKDDWAHGAGGGCVGVEVAHPQCLAAGTAPGEAWLVSTWAGRRR